MAFGWWLLHELKVKVFLLQVVRHINAGITQLVEFQFSKLVVVSSILTARSNLKKKKESDMTTAETLISILTSIKQEANEVVPGNAFNGIDKAATRASYLGQNGKLVEVLRKMGSLEATDRVVVGKVVNEVRDHIEKLLH